MLGQVLMFTYSNVIERIKQCEKKKFAKTKKNGKYAYSEHFLKQKFLKSLFFLKIYNFYSSYSSYLGRSVQIFPTFFTKN